MAQLIPRSKLFGNPALTSAQVSPDGTQISWIAPKDGVLNVWVAPIDSLQHAKTVTNDRHRGIRVYLWAKNSSKILYLQDRNGDENWQLFAVETESREQLRLSPHDKVTTRIQGVSWDYPDEIIVGLNDRDESWHDLYRVNIQTGERELLFLNNQEFGNFTFDRKLRLRLAEKSLPEGGRQIFRVVEDADEPVFQELFKIPFEDDLTTGIIGFDINSEEFYLLNSITRDRAALVKRHWQTQAETIVGAHPRADISRVIVHPTTFRVQAYGANYVTMEWTCITKDIESDLEYLNSSLDGELVVTSRNRDDSLWIITASSAKMPGASYLYRRHDPSLTKIGSAYPDLETETLRPMHGEVITSRDRLKLVSYLTLPDHSVEVPSDPRPKSPVPLVLLVHGGPWARDVYGYNPTHQWLANRGYAVLSVNFRGSTGFGKNFVNAGDLEWGARMHNDLIDAVKWAIGEGITKNNSVAIMGGSYGGYATLVGLSFTPEVFACGIDIVGPSNLQTLIETIPPYWKSFFENFAKRMGDPRTPEGRKMLADRSPLHRANEITKPLLIGQGSNDPRVKQAESDQIVSAMKQNGLPITYVLYPDEGHGFARPQNRLSFNAIAEAFLSSHLGGQFEPVGRDFEGAKFQVQEGPEQIPGLSPPVAD